MNQPLLSVEGLCPQCRKRFEVRGLPPLVCPVCGLRHAAAAPPASDGLAECQLCACPQLYRQKDFNRRLGLMIVIVAAGLALAGYAVAGFWAGTSVLVAATALDRVIWFSRDQVIVCYRCQAVHRGYQAHPSVGGFDLAVHDAYRARIADAPRR
ncbi:MAG: hypothetical protein U1E76_13215 [Planctomycetota bacterium]